MVPFVVRRHFHYSQQAQWLSNICIIRDTFRKTDTGSQENNAANPDFQELQLAEQLQTFFGSSLSPSAETCPDVAISSRPKWYLLSFGLSSL